MLLRRSPLGVGWKLCWSTTLAKTCVLRALRALRTAAGVEPTADSAGDRDTRREDTKDEEEMLEARDLADGEPWERRLIWGREGGRAFELSKDSLVVDQSMDN